MKFWSSAFKFSAAAAVAWGLSAPLGEAQAEKYKIFLSMSYIGNDWQAEAANIGKGHGGA